MKNIIALVAMMTLTSSAYASLARSLALGEKVTVNLFVEDSRYIFMNPAAITNYADSLFFEWGGDAISALSNDATLSSDASPKAMGGFLKKAGNLAYGVYLGNESNTASFVNILASNNSGTYLPTSDNLVDFFVAGGDSMKWGANLVYNNNATTAQTKDKNLALRLGTEMGDFSGYLHMALARTTQNFTRTKEQRMKGKLGFDVGTSYKFGGNKAYVDFQKLDWDQYDGTIKSKTGYTQIIAGFGHTKEISSTTRVYTKLELTRLDVKADVAANGSTAAYKAELTNTVLPVMFGFEADAKSWLRLRGSISHNLYGKVHSKNLYQFAGIAQLGATSLKSAAINSYSGDMTTGGTGSALESDKTIANSTTVSTGSSLLFGNLEVDGMIGLSSTNRASTTTSSGGVLALDNFLTRVGMTYKF